MKLTVVPEVCKGHGLCARIAPDLFELDDSGLAFFRVDKISDEFESVARKAMFICPEGAIVPKS